MDAKAAAGRTALHDLTKATSNATYPAQLLSGLSTTTVLGLSTNMAFRTLATASITRFSKWDIRQVIKLPAAMTDVCFNKPIITSFDY